MHSHCLLLNPRLTRQNNFTQKAVQTWLPLYRVEKVLTNSNHFIRKTGTNYTQCAHRIRLRPIRLTEPPEDIQEIDPAKFEADPSRRRTRNEPKLFDEYIPNLLEEERSTAFSKDCNSSTLANTPQRNCSSEWRACSAIGSTSTSNSFGTANTCNAASGNQHLHQ